MKFDSKKHNQQIKANYVVLGHFVCWTVRDFRIPFKEFTARLKKAGMPETLAKETSAKSA